MTLRIKGLIVNPFREMKKLLIWQNLFARRLYNNSVIKLLLDTHINNSSIPPTWWNIRIFWSVNLKKMNKTTLWIYVYIYMYIQYIYICIKLLFIEKTDWKFSKSSNIGHFSKNGSQGISCYGVWVGTARVRVWVFFSLILSSVTYLRDKWKWGAMFQINL